MARPRRFTFFDDDDEDEEDEFAVNDFSLEDLLSRFAGLLSPGSVAPEPSAPKKATADNARWIPPGEATTIQGVSVSDGMLYVGKSLRSLGGFGQEPALIDPSAKVAPQGKSGVADYRGFYPSYSNMSPAARRLHLEWLAGGRTDPDIHIGHVFQFFYGLERRLMSPLLQSGKKAAKAESELTPEESVALRREILRLMVTYDDTTFQRFAGELLEFLVLKDLLDNAPPTALPDAELVAAMPRTGYDLPQLLSVALHRMAVQKLPISAGWAWAWFFHDPESPMRTVLVRCPDETRRLFLSRFDEAVRVSHRKGILLRSIKATVSVFYDLANPAGRQRVSLTQGRNAESIHQVSRTQLNSIRAVADDAMTALDAYSRRVGREEERRDALPIVALLPDPLFAEHPAMQTFRAYLDATVPAEPAVVATIPAATLLTHWREGDTDAPLSRADALTMLDAIDRLGFVLEPDLRTGGAAIAGPTAAPSSQDAVVVIARRSANPSGATVGPPVSASSGTTAIMAKTLVRGIGIPLLVRAARAGGSGESAALPSLLPLAQRLPHAARSDSASIAVRLAYLVANPKESAKLPKPKDPALAELTDHDRARLADVLAAAASLSGTVGPAAVAELIRLFALLKLPDSEVYSRLHAPTTTASAATAKPSARTARKPSGVVAIDHALVRQKQAESAQISTLLADIFTDEEADKPVASPAALPPTALPPALGSLDTRHAAFLRALLARDSWTKAEVAALARAENLLPNAALEALNEAAFERFDEPILEGDDPIYVSVELARQLL